MPQLKGKQSVEAGQIHFETQAFLRLYLLTSYLGLCDVFEAIGNIAPGREFMIAMRTPRGAAKNGYPYRRPELVGALGARVFQQLFAQFPF